ncbi:efflux RND transporter periplasmic adaptor subunit [Acetobacteraceae bacterium H6797]|nr:efflux RND transporter periplasmic adaptor subunit [Acetobacteraceae bacterium H6797]
MTQIDPRSGRDKPLVARRLAGMLALGLTGLSLVACDEQKAQAQGQPPQAPPPQVVALTLKQQPVTLTTVLPGRVTAFETAEVRPQVNGVLRERLFEQGALVQAGQKLFQIDPAPYRAELASAQASLAKAEATLASARLTVNKYRPLVAQNAVSRLDYDNAVATQKQAEADVASAKAAVDTAQINLDYTTLSAPITGRASRANLTVGALVTSGQTQALVTITRLDPIYVDVTQPSTTLLRLRREMEAGRLRRTDDGKAEVRLTLEDGTEYPLAGKLQFSEVTVDSGTGAVTLRAEFPNPNGTLMPGMFVRERIEEGVAQNALLVPQLGVTRNVKGQPVAMVVQADGTVAQRMLDIGHAVGNKWLVNGGFQQGDRLIVDGLQRVAPGAKPQVTEMTPEDFDRKQQEGAQGAAASARANVGG